MNYIEMTAGTVLATNNTAQPLEILAPAVPNAAVDLEGFFHHFVEIAKEAWAGPSITRDDEVRLMDHGAPMSVTTLLAERGNF
jgi:hypothetical protein